VVLEIKQGGEVRGTVLTYDIGQGPDETEYVETIFPIYSDSPTIEEVTLVFFDGGDGAFLVDELALSTDPYVVNDPAYVPTSGPTLDDEELLDYVQSQTARYFVDQVVGRSFHVRDRSAVDSPSSVAATAFGLSVYTVIAEKVNTLNPQVGDPWHIVSKDGVLITPEEARHRVRTLLDDFLTIQSLQPNLETGEGDPDRVYGIAGFFYHFIEEDLRRADESEMSVIDTAILLTSALQAGEYFGGDLKAKAETLLQGVNWDFVFFDPEKAFRLAWLPEAKRGFAIEDPAGIGFLSDGTIGRPTDELLLVNFLALASDPSNVAYQQALYSYPRVERTYVSSTTGEEIPVVNSFFGSPFTYLYGHLYFDFEALGLDRPDLVSAELFFPEPVDWWTNSVNGFHAARQFCIDRGEFFPFSFHELSWGVSAVERPDERYEGLYGSPPAENGPTHDGTVATHISFSSLPFFRASDAEKVSDNLGFQAIRYAYGNMFEDLFGPYGPVDSYNDKAEFSGVTLGLDQGPIVLSIENYRSRLLWDTFMRNERIRAASEIIFGHVPIIAPIADQTVTAGETLSFTLTATDEDGDPGIEIFSDDLPDAATLTNDGAGNVTFAWTPTQDEVGTRVVSFRVRDTYRENRERTFVSLMVEEPPDTGPEAIITSPEAGRILSGLVTIRATTSDPANTLLGKLFLDGRFLSFKWGSELRYDLQTAYFENGAHVIEVRFYHRGLRKFLVAEGVFEFANDELIRPSILIAEPTAGSVVSGKVDVLIEASDPGQTYYSFLYVDGRYVSRQFSIARPHALDTTRFKNGIHTLKVKSYHRLLRFFMEDEITVEFDNTGPGSPPLFISSPPDGATVSGFTAIEVTHNPWEFLVFGRLYVDGRLYALDFLPPFRFILNTSRLSNGPHRIRVAAYSLRRRTLLEDEITLNVDG